MNSNRLNQFYDTTFYTIENVKSLKILLDKILENESLVIELHADLDFSHSKLVKVMDSIGQLEVDHFLKSIKD